MSLTIYPTNVKFNNNGEYKSIIAAAESSNVGTPYDSNPAMDGIASSGASNDYARGDHVHPTDTTRQAKIIASGILKGDGTGGVSVATAGTDYATPAQVNAKYTKPSGGIPLSDLAGQGTTNAGKFVVVGSDGKLTIAAINSAGGVSF
jgi:hypothetical protein